MPSLPGMAEGHPAQPTHDVRMVGHGSNSWGVVAVIGYWSGLVDATGPPRVQLVVEQVFQLSIWVGADYMGGHFACCINVPDPNVFYVDCRYPAIEAEIWRL
jgi:hypothetical protein